MGRKTRFVKVRLDVVLDVGRDVDVLPFEVMELAASGAAIKFVAAGLRAALRPRNRSRIAVVMPVQRGMKLWYPKTAQRGARRVDHAGKPPTEVRTKKKRS